MVNELNDLFKRQKSLERVYLIIKILEFCNISPISIRQLSSILKVDNKTTRYYLKKLSDFVEKRYNLGYVLNKQGKSVAKEINFTLNKKKIDILNEIKNKRHHIHLINEDWKNIINKKRKLIKKNELKFHWYNLPDNFTLKVNLLEFIKFLDKIKSDFNIKSDRQLSLKLGYNEKLIVTYRRGKHNPSVKIVKKMCNLANVSYISLEKENIFKEKFPVEIDKNVLQLRTHLINEGHLGKDCSLYHNYDPLLLKKFQECIKKLSRKVYHPRLTSKDIYILTDKFTSWLINFTDVEFGKTSKANPNLHILEQNNFELFKNHMNITFSEEGTFHLMLHKKYKNFYVDYFIGLSRAVDITEITPKIYKNNLDFGWLGFSKLPVSLQKILVKKRCNLLDDEILYLYKFLNLSLDKFIPKPTGIYKSKKNNISLYWSWSTQNKDIVRAIQNLIFLDTWTYKKAKEFYKIWNKFYSKPLLTEELEEVNKVRKKYNCKGVPVFWIKEHMQKCFPSIKINEKDFPKK